MDLRDLNRATQKDEYPMPIAEVFVNADVGHKILCFMDGNARCNQIFMAPKDVHKTAFRVPGSVGLFKYLVMTYGLKNVGSTYQRAMNYIFNDLIETWWRSTLTMSWSNRHPLGAHMRFA
jgi:hypothetical protein